MQALSINGPGIDCNNFAGNFTSLFWHQQEALSLSQDKTSASTLAQALFCWHRGHRRASICITSDCDIKMASFKRGDGSILNCTANKQKA